MSVFPQVEDGDQDLVGGSEDGLAARAAGDAAWSTAGCLTDLLAVLFQPGDQGVGQVAELRAGHAGQLGVPQVVEREGARAVR